MEISDYSVESLRTRGVLAELGAQGNVLVVDREHVGIRAQDLVHARANPPVTPPLDEEGRVVGNVMPIDFEQAVHETHIADSSRRSGWHNVSPMEIRDYALALLGAETIEAKLRPPPNDLTDAASGAAVRIAAPGRPSNLTHDPAIRVKTPKLSGMSDPVQRGRILHGLANHELQAAELFAWALLAWPEMPSAFRRGCLSILADEQRHCRLYMDRMATLGVSFGDHPVTAHFWRKIDSIETPLQFVCAMGLTFENANLDFALEHAEAARGAGDDETAAVLEQVHEDEIGHVRFAWQWFRKLKPADQDDVEVYCANVSWPHGPERARGKTFDVSSRTAAGLDPAFIAMLERTAPTAPGGAAR